MPVWKHFRNAFARDAGLRIDHRLLSPSLKNRLVAGGVAREVRSWGKNQRSRASSDRTGGDRPNPGPEESAGLMARKLKTYQTSLGFFDLAIAAPSMKAALQAWGLKTNLFHQGFARETDDPAIVAATVAKPGVVLRRPVGSDGAFSEHAELPKELPIDRVKERTAKARATTSEAPAQKVDDKAAREAALAFESERKRRDSERRKEETAREKERKRREQAIAKAETALEEAQRDHETKVEEIKRDRAALDRRSLAEDARWEKQKEQLETALRRARN
jgi:colicin import membrane protein